MCSPRRTSTRPTSNNSHLHKKQAPLASTKSDSDDLNHQRRSSPFNSQRTSETNVALDSSVGCHQTDGRTTSSSFVTGDPQATAEQACTCRVKDDDSMKMKGASEVDFAKRTFTMQANGKCRHCIFLWAADVMEDRMSGMTQRQAAEDFAKCMLHMLFRDGNLHQGSITQSKPNVFSRETTPPMVNEFSFCQLSAQDDNPKTPQLGVGAIENASSFYRLQARSPSTPTSGSPLVQGLGSFSGSSVGSNGASVHQQQHPNAPSTPDSAFSSLVQGLGTFSGSSVECNDTSVYQERPIPASSALAHGPGSLSGSAVHISDSRNAQYPASGTSDDVLKVATAKDGPETQLSPFLSIDASYTAVLKNAPTSPPLALSLSPIDGFLALDRFEPCVRPISSPLKLVDRLPLSPGSHDQNFAESSNESAFSLPSFRLGSPIVNDQTTAGDRNVSGLERVGTKRCCNFDTEASTMRPHKGPKLRASDCDVLSTWSKSSFPERMDCESPPDQQCFDRTPGGGGGGGATLSSFNPALVIQQADSNPNDSPLVNQARDDSEDDRVDKSHPDNGEREEEFDGAARLKEKEQTENEEEKIAGCEEREEGDDDGNEDNAEEGTGDPAASAPVRRSGSNGQGGGNTARFIAVEKFRVDEDTKKVVVVATYRTKAEARKKEKFGRKKLDSLLKHSEIDDSGYGYRVAAEYSAPASPNRFSRPKNYPRRVQHRHRDGSAYTTHASVRQAAESTGVSEKVIRRILRREGTPYSKNHLFFRYHGETHEPWSEMDVKSKCNKPVQKLDLKTGQVLKYYRNLALAKQDNGMKPGCREIVYVCNGVAGREQAGGFFWRWYGTDTLPRPAMDPSAVQLLEEVPSYEGSGKKKVDQICKDTGRLIKTHDSIAAAARAVVGKISCTGISDCCLGKKLDRMAHGFFWRTHGTTFLPPIVNQNGSEREQVPAVGAGSAIEALAATAVEEV